MTYAYIYPKSKLKHEVKKMKNVTIYITKNELEHLNNAELLERLSAILEETQITFYNEYIHKQFTELNSELNMGLKFINNIKKILHIENNEIYISGQIDGMISTYVHLINEQLKKKELHYQLNSYLSNTKPREILSFIYDKHIVQNKEIAEKYGNYSNEVLKKLLQLDCLTKTKGNKTSFYSVTETGIEYMNLTMKKHKYHQQKHEKWKSILENFDNDHEKNTFEKYSSDKYVITDNSNRSYYGSKQNQRRKYRLPVIRSYQNQY